MNCKVQIIFTTHDPLTLSDVLNTNIVYLDKSSNDFHILYDEFTKRPMRSFAANITDLLADSFFIDDGLVGDFAKDKITEVVEWLEDNDNKENHKYFFKVIKNIDEPIIQRKLAEMYDFKMDETLTVELIDKQIQDLQALKKQIQDDSH